MNSRYTIRWIAGLVLLGMAMTVTPAAYAQSEGEPEKAKAFSSEELEALAAPIALYPDALVAQVLMASTYPLEVVQADRWTTEHKDLAADALTAEVKKEDWDESVKSLVNFPQVLTMMSKDLDWTTKLGDAFIADQAAVMAAVQRLRFKAKEAGNLESNKEQEIIVQDTPPTTVVVQNAPPPPPQTIIIESASPTVVYVPTYNPAVVYGTWMYPAYPPPVPYYPPGYVASRAVAFGVGVAVGACWNNYAHGGCNWHGGDVNINVNRNTNVNNNFNRNNVNNINNVSGNRSGGASANSFKHDPEHRKGVSYRDQASARKVGASGQQSAAKAREDFRGRAEAGQKDIARGGADAYRGSGSAGNRASGSTGSAGNRASPSTGNRSSGSAGGSGNRASAGTSDRSSGSAGRSPSASDRSSGSTSSRSSPQKRSSAFSGSDRAGSSARSASSRGQSSRSSASRSGGGRSRGGGGRR